MNLKQNWSWYNLRGVSSLERGKVWVEVKQTQSRVIHGFTTENRFLGETRRVGVCVKACEMFKIFMTLKR